MKAFFLATERQRKKAMAAGWKYAVATGLGIPFDIEDDEQNGEKTQEVTGRQTENAKPLANAQRRTDGDHTQQRPASPTREPMRWKST